MCDSPFHVKSAGYHSNGEYIPVGCGKCPPCRRNRTNGWVFRIMQEDRISDSAYFVTLTYDGDNLPRSYNGLPTLVKSDFQLFMKRLRINLKRAGKQSSLKYYAVGEYGSKFKRPHYHAVIFNLPDTDLIESTWGKGGIHVG